jgi:hypothetical protein
VPFVFSRRESRHRGVRRHILSASLPLADSVAEGVVSLVIFEAFSRN